MNGSGKRKEVKTMMYVRSKLSGQCYKLDFIPQYGGYELITEAEYLAWCEANGI